MPDTPRADQQVIFPARQGAVTPKATWRSSRATCRPRVRWRQDHRPEESGDHRSGTRVRRRTVGARGDHGRPSSRPAMCWCCATSGQRARPGMPGDAGRRHRAIIGAGLGESVALVTDGRFSGGTLGHGGRPPSPRKRRRVATSAWCARGDSITVDCAQAAAATERRRCRAGSPGGPTGAHRHRAIRAACSRSSPKLATTASRGAVTDALDD